MLNPRQILLIKLSWSHLSNRLEDFGDTFYKILFDLEPGLRSLFKNDMESQREKFSFMVNHIVAHVQHEGKIEAGIRALGERHIDYGVKPQHYDTVMIALLLALERRLKKKWDTETKEAWTMALVYVISQMRRAFRTAAS
jgi:methyl-accepting chemotaxis protein